MPRECGAPSTPGAMCGVGPCQNRALVNTGSSAFADDDGGERSLGLLKGPMPMRQQRLLVCFLSVLALATAPAAAQTWPARPITMVVPFPPGPALDLLARLTGVKLGEA